MGVFDELRLAPNTELLADVSLVFLDRARADREPFPDLPARPPLDGQVEDLPLTGRQSPIRLAQLGILAGVGQIPFELLFRERLAQVAFPSRGLPNRLLERIGHRLLQYVGFGAR